MKMNRQIKNVPEKSKRKLFRTNISNFFMRSFMLILYTTIQVAKIA